MNEDKAWDELNEVRARWRSTFSLFQAKRKLQEPAENVKMVVVGILVLSVGFFTVIGDEAAKPIILPWAGFMSVILIGCAIQDFMIAKKVKKLEKEWGNK